MAYPVVAFRLVPAFDFLMGLEDRLNPDGREDYPILALKAIPSNPRAALFRWRVPETVPQAAGISRPNQWRRT